MNHRGQADIDGIDMGAEPESRRTGNRTGQAGGKAGMRADMNLGKPHGAQFTFEQADHIPLRGRARHRRGAGV